MKRVMWIEQKSGESVGPARIGWAEVKDRGKRIDYAGRIFRTLRGRGNDANFRDLESGDDYWISGCKKNGEDAITTIEVEIDDDALQEYWLNIRKSPEDIKVKKFRARGKY